MIRALLAHARPGYSLMLSWPYLLTVYYARAGKLEVATDLLSAAGLSLVLAGGYILNDVMDLRIDRLRREPKALARGELSRTFATVAALACLAAGTIIAFAFATMAFAATLTIVAAGLVAYDLTSKRIGIWKDWFVATLMTSIYALAAAQAGGFAGSRAMTLPIFACWMFCSSAAFEIFSDLADRKIDRDLGCGPRSLQRRPMVWMRIGNALLILGGGMLLLPGFVGAGPFYRWMMPLGAALPIALALASYKPATKMRFIYLEFVCVGVVTTADVLLYP